MTGFVGGHLTDTALEKSASEIHQEQWYERDADHVAGFGLTAYHHGPKDPEGCTTWRDRWRMGVLYGVVTNEGELSRGTLFNQLLDDPHSLLPELDGSFLIAAIDSEAERIVLASDKLGTRHLYYTDGDPFAFGTEVGALTTLLDDPHVDERAISDLVMTGHVWGDKTLAREVKYLPAGTVLEYDRTSGYERSRYWEHPFTQSRGESYLSDLADAYRASVAATASTVGESVGMWLSGELDDRLLAAEFSRHGSMSAYTSSSASGGHPNLAPAVVDELGIDTRQIPIDPEQFVDSVEKSVQLTSGMAELATLLAPSAVFNTPSTPDVFIDGNRQDSALGDGITRLALTQSKSPEEALYRAGHRVDVDTVRRLLNTPFDPMTSFREAVQASNKSGFYNGTMDSYYRNSVSRSAFAHTPLVESQAGTRIPFSNTAFLTAVAKLPLEHRVRTLPFTNGAVPAGTSVPKLELMRRLDERLAAVPDEQTNVAPSRPLWQHATGTAIGSSLKSLRNRMTGGVADDSQSDDGCSMLSKWYRENEAFTEFVDSLLDSACERPYFDADAIRRLQWNHLTGDGSSMNALSGVITSELWIQRYIDHRTNRTEPAAVTTETANAR
ncbi:asparagine synthase [Haloferax sp. DFSO60]|uniref:asparagine synthase n=1 Tax=Haloferax sp. DFSO60 TaxID=3388652 RepID=UPI00397AF1C8